MTNHSSFVQWKERKKEEKMENAEKTYRWIVAYKEIEMVQRNKNWTFFIIVKKWSVGNDYIDQGCPKWTFIYVLYPWVEIYVCI